MARSAALVTGAAGFVGREVVKSLLFSIKAREERDELGRSSELDCNESIRGSDLEDDIFVDCFTHIVCLDVCIDEGYLTYFRDRYGAYADRLLIVKFDITDLIDTRSQMYSAFISTLRHNYVRSVIHTAAIVDTRERSAVREAVLRVNVDAALALFKAAASDSSPVLRMVHLSSASACLRRSKTSRSCAGLASWLGLDFLDSLLGGLELSTYGRSKREGEMKLLEIYNNEIVRFNRKHQQESSATMPNIEDLTNDKLDSNLQSLVDNNPRRSNPIKLVILRPHVVWGRGDPMATDALLAWPGWLPVVIVGDAAQEVTSVHVALLARYILLADYSLKDGGESDRDRDSSRSNCNNSETNSNNSFNEGLDAYKYGISGKVLNIGDRHESFLSLYRRMTGKAGASILSLPIWVSRPLVYIAQSMDCLWANVRKIFTGINSNNTFHLLRILNPNNLAYMSRGLLDDKEFVDDFKTHCQLIFNTALAVVPSSFKNRFSTANNESKFQNWLKKANPNPNLTLDIDSEVYLLKSNIEHSAGYPILPYYSAAYFSYLAPLQRIEFVRSHAISQPWILGNLHLRNRVIKAATFESMCSASDGVPTEELVDFHVSVVAGGAAMTTIAYASVSHDGRSFPTQICLASPSISSVSSGKMSPDFNTSPLLRTKNVLTRLCNACHAHGGKVSIQLTHAGAFADPSFNNGATAKGPSAIFNPLTMTHATPLEPDDMDRIESDFVNAVDCCKAIGFDAVEIHLGHGYLLSQFLSARTNPKYANNPDKRLEFPLRILKAVCDRAHSTDCAVNNTDNGTGNDMKPNGKPNQSKWLAVLVKYNVSELLERDLPWGDIVKFTRAFHDAGADLLVPSGGHVMVNGLHMLRGGAPIQEMAQAQSNPFKAGILRWLGRFLVPTELYRESFFRERSISAFLAAGVPLAKLCLVGGVQKIETAISAVDPVSGLGAGAVQMGRALLADPNYCIKNGIFTPSSSSGSIEQEPLNVCDQSNRCIVGATMALQPLNCAKYCTCEASGVGCISANKLDF